MNKFKTWDVSKVLDFHRKLTPVRFLSLKNLTLKMIMLIVLSSACRAQSPVIVEQSAEPVLCLSVFSANIYYQERMEEIKNKTNQTMIY
jgi:hypothetical protein